MPMILVKKNPRGKVIRELSSEEETAVKTVCGLKRPATMAQHNLANDLLREMREYDAWLQCDCIPGDSPAMNFAALKNNTGTLYLSSFNHEHAPECPMYRQLSGNEEETSFFGASRHPVSTRINYRNFLPPDDSNSVIRSVVSLQRAFMRQSALSVRKETSVRLGRLLLSLIEDAGLNKLDSLANPRIRTNYRECLDAIRQVTLQQEYIRGRALSEIIHFRPGMSERSQERLMETLENSERHWPARRKHMFFQIFMAQHICRDAVEIHWANGNIQVIRPVRGISINGEAQGGIRPLLGSAFAGVPMGRTICEGVMFLSTDMSGACGQQTGTKHAHCSSASLKESQVRAELSLKGPCLSRSLC
uniref:YagA n=1 Tax=Escherichia coli TaxID=562 RepID=A0A8F1IF23_ECOLX|nr:hypothetical protein IHCLGBEB_00014 [Escherichia coli]